MGRHTPQAAGSPAKGPGASRSRGAGPSRAAAPTTSPTFARSAALYAQAREVIAGGVTSSVRAAAHPLYFERGEGAYLWDVDGNRYVDFVLGYGPLVLGHAPAILRHALSRQAERGLTFGSQHRLEVEVAALLTGIVPGAERVILSTTGTEAAMVAIRVARALTGRPRILKFEGHYHGWSDPLFVSTAFDPARSGPSERPIAVPGTVGLAPASADGVLVVQWNDLEGVKASFAENSAQIAAVIAEPLLVNGGVIPPVPGFLEALRTITRANGALLIFDEVITGFRLALGGAQAHYGITADLAVFAKAMAGGVAMSAVTGSREVLDPVAAGRPAHLGTFNGNPLAAAAAVATLEHLAANAGEIYPRLHALGARLADGLRAAAPALAVRQVGPILNTAIGEPPEVRDVRDRATADSAAHARFVAALLKRGVHTTPRGLWYLSTAHGEEEVDQTIAAAGEAITEAGVTAPDRR
jgi:glutamate-1-semialdehyde 2,1-aminomutase